MFLIWHLSSALSSNGSKAQRRRVSEDRLPEFDLIHSRIKAKVMPLFEWIEGNLRRFFERFEMTVECRKGDTGARGRHGDETIGKAGSQPFAAEVEGESPGFCPQFCGLGDELEDMEEVAKHGKFLVRFRPLHKFGKDDAGAAYLFVVD